MLGAVLNRSQVNLFAAISFEKKKYYLIWIFFHRFHEIVDFSPHEFVQRKQKYLIEEKSHCIRLFC